MNAGAMDSLKISRRETGKMPVLFLGHGSPMNAIEDNEFTQAFRKVAAGISRPESILCISAHWETRGTQLTAIEKPPTIHDFGGFPRKLFEVQYPAKGNPELAKEVKDSLTGTEAFLSTTWGLDHGAWSVLIHLFPEADVPVIQMSLDYKKSPWEHYELARELAFLRRRGVLIAGSGNMVHNLGRIAWDKLDVPGYGYDWANEANLNMNELINDRDHSSLIDYRNLGAAFNLAIPTPEHYIPLLYALALQDKNEEIAFFNNKVTGGSISMTSVKIG